MPNPVEELRLTTEKQAIERHADFSYLREAMHTAAKAAVNKLITVVITAAIAMGGIGVKIYFSQERMTDELKDLKSSLASTNERVAKIWYRGGYDLESNHTASPTSQPTKTN